MRSFLDNVCLEFELGELELEVDFELDLELERKLEFGSKLELELELETEPQLRFYGSSILSRASWSWCVSHRRCLGGVGE